VTLTPSQEPLPETLRYGIVASNETEAAAHAIAAERAEISIRMSLSAGHYNGS
jgi:hypothetical protein